MQLLTHFFLKSEFSKTINAVTENIQVVKSGKKSEDIKIQIFQGPGLKWILIGAAFPFNTASVSTCV